MWFLSQLQDNSKQKQVQGLYKGDDMLEILKLETYKGLVPWIQFERFYTKSVARILNHTIPSIPSAGKGMKRRAATRRFVRTPLLRHPKFGAGTGQDRLCHLSTRSHNEYQHLLQIQVDSKQLTCQKSVALCLEV
jgi:hypothetical protein